MEGAARRDIWIAGIAAIALALLALIGIWTTAPGIERDLQGRAASALEAAGVRDVTVTPDGRTLTLYGPAREAGTRTAAVAAAEVFGVRAVIDAFGAPAPGTVTAGYIFTADWDGASLALAGHMPSLEEQERLIAAARDIFPGGGIANNLRVQPNPPSENWSEAATGGLRALRALASGRLSIEGASVTLSGTATSEAARSDAGTLLGGLPEPYTMLADIAVAEGAAPAQAAYRFGAAYDGASLALSGALPSEAARTALIAAVSRDGLTVDDKTAIAANAPDGAFADTVTAALTALLKSANFTLGLEDRTLSVAAIAPDSEAREALLAALADLPAAYDWTAEIGIAGEGPAAATSSAADSPARSCQTAMSAALAASPVVFASASADLPASADALVGTLVGIAATCPEARIEIAGHTDASGNAAKNIQLSEDRAAALEAALIVRGVDAARLSAKGYGAARPVAGNDTDENKARNRRIEVIVRP